MPEKPESPNSVVFLDIKVGREDGEFIDNESSVR